MANKGLKEENIMLFLAYQIGTLGLIDTFRRCYDVNRENSEDWWKIW